MYDQTKPDLIVHPQYFKSILPYNLNSYFNVLKLCDLTINLDIQPTLLTETDVRVLNDVVLTPFYHENLIKCSGIKPEYTSYYFDRDISIYTIEENGPRYVIWTKDDPLTICATYVDRIDDRELYQSCERAKAWSFTITSFKSIIVFDLDDTLIDKNGDKLKYADDVLQHARKMYDIMVLYSHGSSLHVDEHVQKFTECTDDTIFDLVLSNNETDTKANKNLLYLYNYFPNVRFTKSTLVDDSLFNWTPEYNSLIVPTSSTLYYALSTL